MTDLFEQATAAQGGPEIVLAGDLGGQPLATLRSFELEEADDVTPEGQFPEYGQFLPVLVDDEERWWECPPALAAMVAEVVEPAVESGAAPEPEEVRVHVDMAAKTESGEWRFVGDVNC